MNRKLINGLLLLTVATGGVGTFTSCKDDSYVDPIENNKTLSSLIELIDKELKGKQDAGDYAAAADLEVVKNKLNALLGAGLLTEENQKYLENLIQNNANYAAGLKVYVDDMIMSLITNVQIEEVYNPAFGTINLPLGIQSSLLCNYYYQSNHEVKFPLVDDNSIVYGDKEVINDLENAGITPKTSEKFGTEVQAIDRLGEIYVTVNPSTIPQDAIEGLPIKLRKTNGEQVLGVLKAVKENDHVKFAGYTRADVKPDNGFYRIDVGVAAEDVASINLELDDNLKQAAKDFAKDPSKSDLLGLAEAIYKQFNNRIPFLGLEFTVPVTQSFEYEKTPWNSAPGGLVLPNIKVDENGNYVTDNDNVSNDPAGDKGTAGSVESDPNANVILRSIYSKYDIAAVTYHPLSYSFDPEGYVPDRRLPQIGHIQEYVNKVFDKVNFELNLGGLNPKDYEIDLSGVKFEVEPTTITIDLAGLPVYKVDKDGNTTDELAGVLGDEAKVVLGYNQTGTPSVNYQPEALNGLINSIVAAVNGEGDDSFISQIQSQVTTQLRNIIGDINGQLEGVNTQISDKIQSIKNEINNELNGRLGDGINRLIDLYNALAKKINNILDDPNAYMQVYAAYRDGNGDLHHFSNVQYDPSVFTPGTGDAITMFLTSYNGELLAPAFKKYVAVVEDLTDGSSVSNINANADYLNTVLEGRQQKVYLPVGGANGLQAGHTYKVAYVALDYRGNMSARNFYVRIAK